MIIENAVLFYKNSDYKRICQTLTNGALELFVFVCLAELLAAVGGVSHFYFWSFSQREAGFNVSVFKSFSSVSCFPARLDAAGERLAEAALSCVINRKLRAALNQRTAVRYETLSSGPCSGVLSGRQVASGSSDCSGAGSGSAFRETHPSVRRNSRNAVLGWRRIPPPEESDSRLPPPASFSS